MSRAFSPQWIKGKIVAGVDSQPTRDICGDRARDYRRIHFTDGSFIYLSAFATEDEPLVRIGYVKPEPTGESI